MAFDINITRKKWKPGEGGGIKPEDWITYVNNDDSMIWLEELPPDKTFDSKGFKLPVKRIALWFSDIKNYEADLCFELESNGKIIFGLGHDPVYLQKILDVAEGLDAFVEADDGQIIRTVDDVFGIDY